MSKSQRKLKAAAAVQLTVWALLSTVEQARAVEIEPLGKALESLLKTKKVFKKQEGESTIFYSKDAAGKPAGVVFIEKGLYPPNCTHTWAIGIEPKSGRVTHVRPIEMACNHAFPTKAASFLDQYKGKGPADVQKLDSEVATIAKATGSCKLATDAVKRSITTWQSAKGKF